MDSWITNAKQIQILINYFLKFIRRERERERELKNTAFIFTTGSIRWELQREMTKYGTGFKVWYWQKRPATALKSKATSSTCIRLWSINFFHQGVAMNSKLNRAAITLFLGHSHTLWWLPTGNHSKDASNAHRSREPQIRASPGMMFLVWSSLGTSSFDLEKSDITLCWEEKWGQYEFPARSDCWWSVRVFRLKFKISSEPTPWSRSFSWGAGWGTSRNTKMLSRKKRWIHQTPPPQFLLLISCPPSNDQRPETIYFPLGIKHGQRYGLDLTNVLRSKFWSLARSKLWTNERKQIRFSQWIWKAISKLNLKLIVSTMFQISWAPIHLDYDGLLEWVMSPLLKNGCSNSQDGKFPSRQWKPSHLELVEVVHHINLRVVQRLVELGMRSPNLY